MDAERIKESVSALESVCSAEDDIFETVGVLVADIVDVYEAEDEAEFDKQKLDCIRTAIELIKRIANLKPC